MIPQNREDFTEYCLRKLGQPVIQVNVALEQVEDRVDEALFKFYERHYHAVEDIFIIHDITTPEKILDSNGNEVLDSNGDPTYTTGTDTEAGYIQLNKDDIIAVTNVFRPRYVGGSYSVQFDFYIQELYNMINPNNMGGGLSYYYMSQTHLALINRFFSPDRQYQYNPLTGKLIVAGGLKDADNRYGGLVIRALKKVHGEAIDSNTVVQNIWSNRWLQNYATALIKQQWGQNMSKYQQVQLIGGVTMNGSEIFQQASEDIVRLEEELQNAYEFPPAFFVG